MAFKISNFAQKRWERGTEIKYIRANLINFTLVHYSCQSTHWSTQHERVHIKVKIKSTILSLKDIFVSTRKRQRLWSNFDWKTIFLTNIQTPIIHFILFLQLKSVFEKRQQWQPLLCFKREEFLFYHNYHSNFMAFLFLVFNLSQPLRRGG